MSCGPWPSRLPTGRRPKHVKETWHGLETLVPMVRTPICTAPLPWHDEDRPAPFPRGRLDRLSGYRRESGNPGNSAHLPYPPQIHTPAPNKRKGQARPCPGHPRNRRAPPAQGRNVNEKEFLRREAGLETARIRLRGQASGLTSSRRGLAGPYASAAGKGGLGVGLGGCAPARGGYGRLRGSEDPSVQPPECPVSPPSCPPLNRPGKSGIIGKLSFDMPVAVIRPRLLRRVTRSVRALAGATPRAGCCLEAQEMLRLPA